MYLLLGLYRYDNMWQLKDHQLKDHRIIVPWCSLMLTRHKEI